MKCSFSVTLRAAALAAATAIAGAGGASAEFVVASGFDLLATPSKGGTVFNGLSFGGYAGSLSTVVLGVNSPYANDPNYNDGTQLCGAGMFNFGDGCVVTGNTDSILHRLEDATQSDGDIALEFVALSMRPLDQSYQFDPTITWDFGNNIQEAFEIRILKDLTTDTWIYGEDLGSTMSINFDANDLGGTFSSALSFSFDVVGLDTGIVAENAGTLSLTQPASYWDRENPDAVHIPGVNFWLAGDNNTTQDFFTTEATHCDGPSKCHSTIPATPLPGGLPLMGTALLLFTGAAWRRRRAA